MNIEWNRVTWYSKLIAIIVFVSTFWLAFCFGVQYEKLMEFKRTTPESEVSIPSIGDVVLSVGQTKSLGEFKITLNSVPNDYRCPVDVQCIQAGAINTNVTFVYGKEAVTKNMPSDEVPQEFAGYKISIVEINPPLYSKKPTEQSEYRIKFHIEKAK
ncbi:MAG: hypothetical protein AB201_01970 [Parcubacteria bacterium C7867-006]|nr:MAG: hypothetical protein AB201_01970 [Parcubacteria bacterium C7867-006]